MERNFVKINETDYFMESEPVETDEEMEAKGFQKVTGEQFDEAFNLYFQVMNNEITYEDVLKKLGL